MKGAEVRTDIVRKLLFTSTLITPIDVAAILEVEINRDLDDEDLHRLVGMIICRWLREDDVGRRIAEACFPRTTIGHVLAEASDTDLDSLRPWLRSVGISGFRFTTIESVGDYDQDLLNQA
jgi:hypothetical protein